MNEKLWKTKTFWTGLGGVVAGIGLVVLGDVGEGVNTIVVGLAAIFGRAALAKK